VASDAQPDFDLVAASLRADMGDVGSFMEALAAKLEDALPGAVEVERGRSRMMGPKQVQRIVVDTGGERLELLRGNGEHVQARRARLSGGIVLKTEPIELDGWIDALTRALAIEAAHSERTRLALERLLLAG
jgi:hypothetical protein